MNITDEDLAAYCELFDLDPTEINAEGHRRDLEVFSRHRMTARRKALEDAAKMFDALAERQAAMMVRAMIGGETDET